jgi:hypothetical protein
MGKRDDAMALIGSVLKPGVEIRSKRDSDLFKKYTGTSHETLVENWKGGGIMSACNGFVSWYAGRMGVSITDADHKKASWFTLEAALRAIGKGHAWVPADGNADPQKGDILHHRKEGTGLHVDVAMGLTADRRLIRAAAGQITFLKPRNPAKEEDVLKIVTGTGRYSYRNLLGWLDLERFFEPASGPEATPNVNWAIGWWDVTDSQQYYYHFDTDGSVRYMKQRPKMMFVPPKTPINTGRYSFRQHNVVFIRWNPWDGEPTEETFTADGVRQTMKGTSNRFEPLAARRM